MTESGSLGRTLSLRIAAGLVVAFLLAVGGWGFAQDALVASPTPAASAR